MTKLVLVDDHKVFLQGIEALLLRSEEFDVLATFTNGLELMRFLAEGHLPDVVLLDIEMGIPNGISVAEHVLQQYPSVKVIMLSVSFDEDFIDQLMESGISGYLLKSVSFPELRKAIKDVATGSFAFSPEVMEVIVKGYKASSGLNVFADEEKSGRLSDREVELIQLIGEELTMKEIAGKLFLSEHTVKTHRKNIMTKLGVRNTAGLIKKAFLLGFIE